ncbi:MAG: PAS domain S-box protein, partial [Candidatus Thorarchaeota archaeon]
YNARAKQESIKLSSLGPDFTHPNRTILDAIDQGILIIDQRGRIQDSNKSFLDMVSVVRTSVVSRRVEDFIADKDIKRLQDAIKTCDLNRPNQIEVHWKCKDSQDCHSDVYVIKIAESQYLLMIRPIPEKTEDELELQYQTLLNQAQVGIMIWQVNPARISYVNPRICDLLGYSEEELLSFRGEDAFCVLHPEDRATVAGRFKQRLDGADVQRVYETRGLRKDGESIWLQVAASFITYRGEPASLTTILDVTDQVLARTELQNSEVKYRSLAEGSIQGIMLLKDDRIWYANPAYASITGYSLQELYDMSPDEVLNIIHPDERADILEQYNAFTKQSANPIRGEYRILRKDGSVKWIVGIMKMLTIDNAPIIQHVLVDITNRKHVEDALRESEERYRALFDIAPSAFVLSDYKGNIIATNERALSLFDYTWDEIRFRLVPSFYSKESDREIVLERLRKDGVVNSLDVELLKKDGSSFQSVMDSRTIMLGGREVLFTAIRDVTEQRQAAKDLRESEEKYRTLVENIQDGVFIIQNERMAYVNDSLAEMLGTTREEMEGTKFQEHIAPEDLDLVTERYFRRQQGEDVPPEYEFRLLHKDGRRVVVNLNIGITSYKDGIASIGTLKNITERKEAENRRKAAVETAMLYLDVMGHDIRNQMQGIMIGAEILKANDQSNSTIESIIESVKVCQKLISDTYATENLLSSPLEETNLTSVIESVMADMKNTYPEIIVDSELLDEPVLIMADTHLSYLIHLIFENAILHNPSDTKSVCINLEENDSEYQLTIADNGRGLDEFRKANLFNKDRRFGGVGIHQARGIMEKYLGTISVEDRIDGDYVSGTKFILSFPKY